MEQPNQNLNNFTPYMDNETFEKFFQEYHKKLTEEVELRTPRIEAVIGELSEQSENTQQLRMSQNLCEPSTSTKQPDGAASVAATAKTQFEGTLPFTPLTQKYEDDQKQALGNENDMNAAPGQCKIVFVEEGTFVPSVNDFNDTVFRFMMPQHFWNIIHIEPPRANSKFHFYLVVQDRLPATSTTTNQLTEKSNVIVAIRQAVLRKDSLTHIKNVARLTTSQYMSRSSKHSDLLSISWENCIGNDPIACGVMNVQKLSFNPFTKTGRVKSDELWKEVATSFQFDNSTTEQQHDYKLYTPNFKLPDDFKPLATSTPLMKKTFFDTEFDCHNIEKPDCLVISKLVYVIPRIRQPNKKTGCSESKNHQTTTEEDFKFEIPEVPLIQDPSRSPVPNYGHNFTENQMVEIPFQTNIDLSTSFERECKVTKKRHTN